MAVVNTGERERERVREPRVHASTHACIRACVLACVSVRALFVERASSKRAVLMYIFSNQRRDGVTG